MALILLLNLLIAMMGDTYTTTQDNSILEWRVDYARRILRLELQVEFLAKIGLKLNAGTHMPGKGWVFVFRNYKPNAEGTRTKKSMFDADIEAEAEFDQLDDEAGGADVLAGLDENARARMEAVRDRRRAALKGLSDPREDRRSD